MFKNVFLIVLICFSFSTTNSFSQISIEKATQGVDRSFRKEAEQKLNSKLQAPLVIKENLMGCGQECLIKEINLMGCKISDPKEFEPIIEKYKNKKSDLEDLKSLTKAIELHCFQKGIIATCLLPQQEFNNGRATLHLIEEKIDG